MKMFGLKNNIVVLMADNDYDRELIGDLMFESEFVGIDMSYINGVFTFQNKKNTKDLCDYLDKFNCQLELMIDF